MTPSWVATIALLSWPFFAWYFYLTRPFNQATLWTVLGAQLLLPVGAIIKFEMVPGFDKDSIPSLCIFIACLVIARNRFRIFRRGGLAEILILMNLLGPVITSALNTDQIIVGNRLLPAVGLYDGFSALEQAFISLIPFFVGRQFLSGSADGKGILRILVVTGLIYSFPLLFEMRFSPQLHNWVYGYAPSDFIQSVRGAGYRPMVFMGHGLLAALFSMMAVVAATGLWRARIGILTISAGWLSAYLSVILLLCKSLGATLYGMALFPMVRWASPRIQMQTAVVLVCVALSYPMMRVLDIFPTHYFSELATSVSVERAESLKFRFDNEDSLLRHAVERPIFGWGRYGRNRVYDRVSGDDDSVTDGRWVITIGQFGLFGFVAEFGLLSLGLFRAFAAFDRGSSAQELICSACLSLIVAINIVDLLPNSGLTPWTWLLAGALLGRAEYLAAAKRRSKSKSIGNGYSDEVRKGTESARI